MDSFVFGFRDRFLDKVLTTFLSHLHFISENLKLGNIPEGGKQWQFCVIALQTWICVLVSLMS